MAQKITTYINCIAMFVFVACGNNEPAPSQSRNSSFGKTKTEGSKLNGSDSKIGTQTNSNQNRSGTSTSGTTTGGSQTQQIATPSGTGLRRVVNSEIDTPMGTVTIQNTVRVGVDDPSAACTSLTKVNFVPGDLCSYDFCGHDNGHHTIGVQNTVTKLAEILRTKLAMNASSPCENRNMVDKLKSLTELNLEAKSLTDISPLKRLTRLTTLNLNNNQLTSLNDLTGMTELITFKANNNQLTSCSGLANSTNLESIDLSTNFLSSIDTFNNFMKIKKLDVSNNNIKSIITFLERHNQSDTTVEIAIAGNPDILTESAANPKIIKDIGSCAVAQGLNVETYSPECHFKYGVTVIHMGAQNIGL